MQVCCSIDPRALDHRTEGFVCVSVQSHQALVQPQRHGRLQANAERHWLIRPLPSQLRWHSQMQLWSGVDAVGSFCRLPWQEPLRRQPHCRLSRRLLLPWSMRREDSAPMPRLLTTSCSPCTSHHKSRRLDMLFVRPPLIRFPRSYRPVLTYRFKGTHHGQIFAFVIARFDCASVNEDRRDVQARNGNHRTRHVLVAATDCQ